MNNYFMETHHHEWILTNRLGSYALGTGNLINQRKYHGLLIASDKAFNRMHLVAGMEELVEWRGESFFLDSSNYSNCIYPEGFLHLVKPWLRPYPAFLYSALPHQNEILILKEIMMDQKTNAVLVRYTNMGMHPLNFELSPKLTMCPHHHVNSPGSLEHTHFESQLNEAENSFFTRRASNGATLFSYLQNGELMTKRKVYYNVFYPWEVMFGYEGVGDQISLYEARFSLKPGHSNVLLFADHQPANPQEMIQSIIQRYKALPLPMDFPKAGNEMILDSIDYEDNILFRRKEYLQILEQALTDFVANDDIVAGYPYYGAWGRDTMMVLNALLRVKGYEDLVERILMKYSRSIKNGLIPNRVAESGFEANYDSVDASLWYVILLWKYAQKKHNKSLWQELIHLGECILTALGQNTDGRYYLRADGLISFSEEFAHGSWMDARIDGISQSPRSGALVEINALWYNALASYQAMIDQYIAAGFNGIVPNAELLRLKEQVKASFQKFCKDDYLADRLLDDTPVMEIRPNAIIALSLPWQLVDKDRMKAVFERSFKELYTFYGIRSLSPQDTAFKKKYYGTQAERDRAYHNGSVWAWLFGAFCGLYMKVYKDEKPKAEIAETLGNFISTLRNGFMRGHIASVAEVWDGESPHFPKGAPAQAFSVAALYNIENYIESLGVDA